MALSASLGPARFCANCSGKMLNLGSDGGKVRCLCSSCQTGKFSRCGGCHLVPYCSKECQLEHRGQHKKLCKDLARREGPGTEAEVIFFTLYWARIPANSFSIPLPIKLPKLEIGWIDAYLSNLLSLVSSIGKEIQDIGKEEIEMIFRFIKSSKGYILFLLSWLKDGKVTEYYFASYFFSIKVDTLTSIERLNSKIRTKSVKNEVWETFLFQFAKFCQILRKVTYKFINIKSMKKKKKRAQYRALKPFYESGLKMLESSSDGRLDSQTNRISLSPGTVCVGCEGDLGGQNAQLLLDYKILREPGTPCVLDISDTA